MRAIKTRYLVLSSVDHRGKIIRQTHRTHSTHAMPCSSVKGPACQVDSEAGLPLPQCSLFGVQCSKGHGHGHGHGHGVFILATSSGHSYSYSYSHSHVMVMVTVTVTVTVTSWPQLQSQSQSRHGHSHRHRHPMVTTIGSTQSLIVISHQGRTPRGVPTGHVEAGP